MTVLLWALVAGAVLGSSPATAGDTRCSTEAGVHDQVACELDEAAVAPLCDGDVPGKLERRVDRKLEVAGRRVRRAGSAPAARTRRLVDKAVARLTAAVRQVTRAAEVGTLDGTCAASAARALEGLRARVEALTVAAPPGLPDWVAGYDGWLRLNAAPLPVRPGDPHRGEKDVFVNRTREEIASGGVQRFPYPNGAIVVKASTRPGEDFVWLVAIMRKRAGSDPAHGDWEFVEYTRQSAGDRFTVAARDGVCWSCHGDVRASSDWVFTLLE
jgi:hypothetical protein